ncbi:gamma-glutamyltransferase family protein [Modestobacter roseus]|uniref:gamma-glutamyltransferase family protein n=1 Tax=Modestobacter roseus TaxID=1181884 RepID=UPI001296A47C|nr:gamma-glutamyltransferase [Modestobacter roseus]MQA34406.1 gamma-glutamyltranspeptidase [Modestobacter roseus]
MTSADPAPARRCAVASPHAQATAAGSDVAARGGTAVDAAIAAAAALTVLYPHQTSLGGDLIGLVRTPDGRISCINASGPAAAATSVADVASRNGGTMPTVGIDTVTVPGVVGGLAAAHALGGRLPWAEVWAAAVDLADTGAEVSSSLGRALVTYRDEVLADPGLRGVFAPDGAPLTAGALLRQPALARTLAQVAAGGAAAFYDGPVAVELLTGLSRLGSRLTAEDLRSFAPETVPPLHRDHDGHTVWTSPLNTQGYQLLQVLGALSHLPGDVDVDGAGAGPLAALWSRANRDRARLLADPRHADVDVDDLLADGALARAAEEAVTAGATDGPTAFVQPRGDTVAVVATDSDGHAACLILSVFHPFGSGLLEPTTGVVLHNRGAYFSLDPASANCLAPGKRPGHTLMPVMVTRGEELAWVVGTMGGKAQPQIHAQVLRALFSGDSPEQAVSTPRWVVGGLGAGEPEDLVLVESDVPAVVRAALVDRGYTLQEYAPHSEMLGHAQVIAVDAGGFTAASDPRSDGRATVVPVPAR